MLEKEIVETKEKEEKLREDYKKVEENAGIVMKEHEDLQVVNQYLQWKDVGHIYTRVKYTFAFCLNLSIFLDEHKQ